VYSSSDPAEDARQLIAQRMSVLHSAMPPFTDHFQLPLFTGHRRWHTTFGQLNQLTSSHGAETAVQHVDEDILTDSNCASLFDSLPDRHSHPVSHSSTCDSQEPYLNTSHSSRSNAERFQASQANAINTIENTIENDFSALDENVDSVQSAVVEQFVLNVNVIQLDDRSNCINPHGQNEHGRRCVESDTGRQTRLTLLGRRHSDPGSIRSTTTVSLSSNSNCDNWYYYDRRLGPGGPLAAQYGRLWTRRSLSMIVSPPAYDDVCNVAPSLTTDQRTTDSLPQPLLTVLQPAYENVTELPPPYQHSELPPSYSDIAQTDEQSDSGVSRQLTCQDCTWQRCAQNWQVSENNVMNCPRWSHSPTLFAGRPAVRWNRNTSVERWTSSINWVMS